MTYICHINNAATQNKQIINKMADKHIKIRDMMPADYGNILSQRTGKTRVHIYQVVNQERTDAEIWPEVLKLAEETLQQKQENRKRLIKLKTAA